MSKKRQKVDWAKIPRAFKKFRWKKHIADPVFFFVFYAKLKINLTWPNAVVPDPSFFKIFYGIALPAAHIPADNPNGSRTL